MDNAVVDKREKETAYPMPEVTNSKKSSTADKAESRFGSKFVKAKLIGYKIS